MFEVMHPVWESSNTQHRVGKAIRKDIARQWQDLIKASHVHQVKPGDLALHILEGRKGDMIHYLRSQGLKPISENVGVMATQITNHLIGSAKEYQNRFQGRDGYAFTDAFDEMMTDHVNRTVSIDNPLHYTNFDGSADETGMLQASAAGANVIGSVVNGQGGEGQAGQAIQGLGAAAAGVPGIGNILGPIMSVSGSLVGMIGAGKRKKKAELAAQEARDAALAQQLLMMQRNRPKINPLFIGGGVVLILILILVAAKS